MRALPSEVPRFDLGLAACVVVASAIEAALAKPGWATLIVPVSGLLIGALLLVRRRQPDAVFVGLVVAVSIEFAAVALDARWTAGAAAAGALVLIYSLARYGRLPRSLLHVGALTILNVAIELAKGASAGVIVAVIALITVVAAIGYLVRRRMQRRDEWVASQLVDERARIARDLHDVIAHYISAIAMKADAAASVADVNPHAAVHALEQIRGAAREALNDVRQVIGILRHEDGTDADAIATPDLRSLAELATSDDGPAVEIVVGDSLHTVPLAASRALYRVAQESVTNARRHADDAQHVRVRVERSGEIVRLTVHDDGRPTTQQREGFGLRGMRERIGLLGGSLAAGPDPAGGWSVTAIVPVRRAAQ